MGGPVKLTDIRTLRFAILGLASLAMPDAAYSGRLILTNVSDKPITCTVDGYSKPVVIPPALTAQLPPNFAQKDPVINSVECGRLRTRQMRITPTGPDGLLVLNGQQTRTLNVLLYPFIPTLQYGNFSSLLTYVVNTYQAQNPQVLLNIVMNPSINIYDFPTLQTLVGPNGYDVLELDMSFLGFLVNNNLITSVSIQGDQPWPIAKQTATFNGTVYAVPSWLCTDFLYYFLNDSRQRLTLKQLKAIQNSSYDRLLVSDFDGSWTMTAMYLDAYVQTYGYASINNAFIMPPDANVIQNLYALVTLCGGKDGNPCIDGRYHNAADGTVEKAFATGHSVLDIGFSERSFFINEYDTVPGILTEQPAVYGEPYETVLLLYTDGFVTNSSTCSSGTCPGDSQAFTTVMTGASMKTYIAFSQDLPSGAPPRHLLVATQPFWNQPIVQNDPLYQQFATIFTGQQYSINPFPNSFTAAQKQAIYAGVCDALKNSLPNYACTGSTTPPPRK